MRTATSQFSDSGGALNGPDLFTELPFLQKSLPTPHSLNPSPLLTENPFFISRKGFCRYPRGIFPNKVPGEFCGGFLVDFFGPLSLKKIGGKTPPKTPRQNSNRNLGVSRPKSTLQGSGLDFLLKSASSHPLPKNRLL